MEIKEEINNFFRKLYYSYFDGVNHYLGQVDFFESISQGEVNKFKQLLSLGADVNKYFLSFNDASRKPYHQHTPLTWAIMNNKMEMARELLTYSNIDVNTVVYDGGTALFWAAKKNNTDLVAELLVRGADETLMTAEKLTQVAEIIAAEKAKNTKQSAQDLASTARELERQKIIATHPSSENYVQETSGVIKVATEVVPANFLSAEQRAQKFVAITIKQAEEWELPRYYQEENKILNLPSDTLAHIATYSTPRAGKNSLTEDQAFEISQTAVNSLRSTTQEEYDLSGLRFKARCN